MASSTCSACLLRGTRRPGGDPVPLIICGASTAVGAFAIKLAVSAGIHPIIAVGGSSSGFIRGVLRAEQGDTFLDYTAYRNPEDLAAAIKQALLAAGIKEGRRAPYALDAVSKPGTYDAVLSRAMTGTSVEKPRLAVVLATIDRSTVDPSVELLEVYSGIAHQGGDVGRRFAYVTCRVLALGLAEGWITPHPYEVRDDGLEALEGALRESREGRIRGKKVLLRMRRAEGD